jgi:hypothetical protein
MEIDWREERGVLFNVKVSTTVKIICSLLGIQ